MTVETPDTKPDIASSQDVKQKVGLTVKFQGASTKFVVKGTTRFSKVFDSFYASSGTQPGTLKFTYNGVRVQPESTPAEHDMMDEEDPEIEAHAQQVGGSRSSGHTDS